MWDMESKEGWEHSKGLGLASPSWEPSMQPHRGEAAGRRGLTHWPHLLLLPPAVWFSRPCLATLSYCPPSSTSPRYCYH